MDIIKFLFGPVTFSIVLIVLAALSAFIVLALMRREKEFNKLEGLADKEAAARGELVKLKEELSLKDQMYNGLKGQYDELEKDSEKLSRESESLKLEIEKLKKAQVKEPPKFQLSIEPKEKPQAKTEEKPKEPSKTENLPDQSITNLLQQIKSIDNPPKDSLE